MSGLHIFFLHFTGSNNPLGISSAADNVEFHSFYTVKDIVGFVVLLSCLLFVVFFCPLIFMEPDNFVPANSLVTPTHILPEWYFLFAYAILRCITSKFGGVVGLISSILVLITLRFTCLSSIKGLVFYGPVKLFFWCFVVIFVLLGLSGGWPPLSPFLALTRCFSFCFFLFFLLLGVLCRFWDKLLL